MKKIWELFEQFHVVLGQELALKDYQELNILLKQLANYVNHLGERELCELKDSVDFLQNAEVSSPFSFGQCGDKVYWKILDDVLYIGGNGPMWSFCNASLDFKKNDDLFSPWKETYFHTVVILDGVTTIGSDAFHGAEISSVIIPGSIKKIEEIAFFDATIEKLVLPNTIETIEEGILNGFRRVVDTLVVSVDIADIKPYAFFNRDDILANHVYLTGSLPEDFTQLIESRLFDGVGRYEIYYPKDWDAENISFYEKLLQKFTDSDDAFQQRLKKALISYIA
ncbi:MAG: leucine-rich repeat protein [Clostridia bacterium]|nr:leucine-rich repeat protein [Clostridia bacterium]